MKVFTILNLIISLYLVNCVLLPRHKAPDFTTTAVVGEEFKKVSLRDYSGKYLIMMFYPFDFTYVCPTELIAFSDALD